MPTGGSSGTGGSGFEFVRVTLDPGAAGALTSLGISVAPTTPAYATKSGAVRFPITLGVVDSTDLTGQIRHAGGLVFTKGTTKARAPSPSPRAS